LEDVKPKVQEFKYESWHDEIVSFGKYKGQMKIKDLPKDYCIWVYKNAHQNAYNKNVRALGCSYSLEKHFK